MQAALGIATYQAAGPDNMMRDPWHMGKTFQVGAANRNGVTAALLAHRGAHVPLDILDGTLGLFDTYLGKPELGPELLGDLGRYYAITDVMHKRYPVGTPNQAYAQGMFELLEKHGISSDDIEQVEIHMPHYGLYAIPATRHASIAAVVVSAVLVAERKLDFYRLHSREGVMTPAVLAMQKKIRLIGREDWKGTEHNRHAIVSVTTKTGTKVQEEVWFRPMTRAELERKFSDLTNPLLGKERTDRLRTLLLEIENAPSVRPLMEALRFRAAAL
jgi:2-methylcitrate dehydratase PrpD